MLTCGLDDQEWLRLVQRCEDATAFLLPVWSLAVCETYGFPGFVLAVKGNGGRVVAGLPVIEVRDLLGRRRLVSLPFTDHCPPLIQEGTDPADFTRSLMLWRARHDRLRLEVLGEVPSATGMHTNEVGTMHLLRLDPHPQHLFPALPRTPNIKSACAA